MEDPCADLSTGTSSSLQGNCTEHGAKGCTPEASNSLSNCLCAKSSEYLATPLSNDRLVEHDPFQDGDNLGTSAGADIQCERIIAGDFLSEAGNAVFPSGVSLRLSDSAELDVKKVDEWLKSRADSLANMGLVFELKNGSEDDLFGDSTSRLSEKEARDSVLNLFSEKDLQSALLEDEAGKESGSMLSKGMPALDPEMLINTGNDTKTTNSVAASNLLMTDQELESLSARGLDFSPQGVAAEKDVQSLEPVEASPEAPNNSESSHTAEIPITYDKASNAIRVVVSTASGQQQILQVCAQSLLQCTGGATVPLESLLSSAILLNTEEAQNEGPEQNGESEDTPMVATATEQNAEGEEPIDEDQGATVLSPMPVSLLCATSSTRKVFQCGIAGCGQVFDKGCKLRVHLMSHAACRPYKCPEENCEWSFATVYKLRRHLATHAGKKEFMCEEEGCGRSFTTIYNLNSHRNLHKRPQFSCPAPDCRRSFANRRKMQLHLREHGDIDAPYKCPDALCGKAYYSANTLASHVRGHHNKEEDLRCPFEGCGRVFERVGKLRLHVRQHTGERPYVCPFANCNWTFASASKLTRHMRKHTGDRRYVCPEPGCKKKFMRPEHLKGHMVVHSGGRPFECPHEGCTKRFAAKSSLYVHLKKHTAAGGSSSSAPHEKLVYPCPMGACSKRYNAKSSLRQHIIMCHSVLIAGDCLDEAGEAGQGAAEMAGTVEDSEQEFVVPLSLDDTMVAEVLAAGQGGVAGVLPNFVLPDSADGEIHVDEVLLEALPGIPEGAAAENGNDSDAQQCTVLDAPLNIAGLLTGELETLTSSRLLQENHSGSARTDYCSNHLYDRQSKKRKAAALGIASASDGKKTEPSNGVALSCADVILTSSAVRDPAAAAGLVIPDDPSPSSDMYSDHILSSVPELSGPATLLAEQSEASEMGTPIRLQDID